MTMSTSMVTITCGLISAGAPPSRRPARRQPAAPDSAARCRRAHRQSAGAPWLRVCSAQGPVLGADLTGFGVGETAGVEGHRDGLGVEFAKVKMEWRPWKPADQLLIGYLFAEDLSTTWPNDLAASAFVDLPKET